MSKKAPYAVAGMILSELAIEIAIPAVIMARLGKWLDLRYGTKPWLIITSLVVAFAISALIVWKRAESFKKLYLQ